MGVYIKDLKVPENCDVCPLFLNFTTCGCDRDYCMFQEVPEPHGDLIDRDALHKLYEDQWHYLQVLDWNENPTAEAMQSGINWCINTMHDDAPTVIPATEEGE